MRFLKATIEGNYLALSDPARAKQILAKELKITDPKVLDITYEDFKAQSPVCALGFATTLLEQFLSTTATS